MFDGIKPKTLLSTPEEWDAFVIGFFEVLCPWPPHCHCEKPGDEAISGEYHYYMAGRGLGFIALSLILTALVKLFKEVIF